MVANPVDALINGNYMGILAWAIGLGLALRHASDTTKEALTQDFTRWHFNSIAWRSV